MKGGFPKGRIGEGALSEELVSDLDVEGDGLQCHRRLAAGLDVVDVQTAGDPDAADPLNVGGDDLLGGLPLAVVKQDFQRKQAFLINPLDYLERPT